MKFAPQHFPGHKLRIFEMVCVGDKQKILLLDKILQNNLRKSVDKFNTKAYIKKCLTK